MCEFSVFFLNIVKLNDIKVAAVWNQKYKGIDRFSSRIYVCLIKLIKGEKGTIRFGEWNVILNEMLIVFLVDKINLKLVFSHD
jgi:hypothetical protein